MTNTHKDFLTELKVLLLKYDAIISFEYGGHERIGDITESSFVARFHPTSAYGDSVVLCTDWVIRPGDLPC
jgi:hypothetical protein